MHDCLGMWPRGSVESSSNRYAPLRGIFRNGTYLPAQRILRSQIAPAALHHRRAGVTLLVHQFRQAKIGDLHRPERACTSPQRAPCTLMHYMPFDLQLQTLREHVECNKRVCCSQHVCSKAFVVNAHKLTFDRLSNIPWWNGADNA